MPKNGRTGGGRERAPAGRGEYGVVYIATGRHAGKCAYYDDDCPEGAVVFVDGPAFISRPEVVPFDALREASVAEQRWWEATRNSERRQEEMASKLRRSRPRSAAAVVGANRRKTRREGWTTMAMPIRAHISVTVRDGKTEWWMRHDCNMSLVPHEGMTLIVGKKDDAEFVDVTTVAYRLEDDSLDIEATIPEKEYESLGSGKLRLVEKKEYVPRLEAAGFVVEHTFDMAKIEAGSRRKRRRARRAR